MVGCIFETNYPIVIKDFLKCVLFAWGPLGSRCPSALITKNCLPTLKGLCIPQVPQPAMLSFVIGCTLCNIPSRVLQNIVPTFWNKTSTNETDIINTNVLKKSTMAKSKGAHFMFLNKTWYATQPPSHLGRSSACIACQESSSSVALGLFRSSTQ